MAVVDIRGTHGSGKSWCVHQLLDHYGNKPITEDGKTIGYKLKNIDAGVLGRYSNVCGGCDGIKSADRVVELAKRFNEDYSLVIMEGILVSHTYQRYHELALELEGYTFCFLDTPKKICISRTRKRRAEKGNTKEFNPKNLLHDWQQIWVRTRQRMIDSGHHVVILPWQDPLPILLETIESKL